MAASRSPLQVAWLVRLRWAAIAAQLASIVGVRFVLRAPFPAAPLALVVGALAVANVVLTLRLRRGARLSDAAIAGNLILDSVALTALLIWTGGAMNPFTTLYLLHVALAGIMVPRRWSLAVTLCAVALFAGLLMARPEAIHVWHTPGMFLLHVRGMWLAFALTAGCLWYFIDRVTTSLRRREEELSAERVERERAARWSALGTLAAGTAHELNTPMGTVAILASELSELLPEGSEARAQADLIRGEIRRCKQILGRMRAHGQDAAAADRVPLGPWITATVDEWRATHPDAPVALTLARAVAAREVSVYAEPLRQAVANLLDNARLAQSSLSPPPPIELTLEPGEERGAFEVAVTDRGVGVPTEHLHRLGEPFFTTREPGMGMGLGLFLVQATASMHRGAMHARSGGGQTRVALSFRDVGAGGETR